MTNPTDISLWIGGILTAPGHAPTEFCSWREDACCGAPDLYLSGRDWSIVIDAPWVLTNPEPDLIAIHGWHAEPAATIRKRSSSSTS